ncbi:ATP/GTP-binding protein [Acinetobacter dispersus]|uniref:GTP-binding protein n=1 Tax=Acinetobacter dispersus TaxID=70348 RepID=UPI001F4A7AB0|nr:ATP/GTP-binding protein [Acinetobacter dispersus]MCH7395436.1 ATP/GTP-binding protein [Acinetobacter dispersus]
MILHQYKIVFGGTMGSGKSTAIKALSEVEVLSTEALNTDTESHEKLLTTVGIDYGELTLEDGFKVGLYGTPGQDRFDFIWAVICKGAIGTIVMIDHAAENPLLDLEQYIQTFQPFGHNIVIAITHIDRMPERTLSIYRDWLKAKELNYPLFFIDARQQDDVLLLVETLIATIEVHYGLTH